MPEAAIGYRVDEFFIRHIPIKPNRRQVPSHGFAGCGVGVRLAEECIRVNLEKIPVAQGKRRGIDPFAVHIYQENNLRVVYRIVFAVHPELHNRCGHGAPFVIDHQKSKEKENERDGKKWIVPVKPFDKHPCQVVVLKGMIYFFHLLAWFEISFNLRP